MYKQISSCSAGIVELMKYGTSLTPANRSKGTAIPRIPRRKRDRCVCIKLQGLNISTIADLNKFKTDPNYWGNST